MGGKLEAFEKQKRRKTVITELVLKPRESIKQVEEITDFLKKQLKVHAAVKTVTTIMVMVNKAKLKKWKPERVFINDDYIKEAQQKYKEIRKAADEPKRKGKNVKIGYNKIIRDGIVWKWNNSTWRS